MALVRDNQARTVQRWLERHGAGSAKLPPTSNEAFGLDETGFFTSFYTKCVRGLRILSQQSSKLEGVDHKSRRCLRQACEKLLLLEDAFSSGKIESSLDNHEHLRKAIARSLYEIGKRIIRDLDAIQESSGEYSHAELVSDLENYIEQAKNVVAQDASDTDSISSLSSEDDEVRQKTLRAGRRLGTFEVQLVARHVDLLLQLCPSIEQVYENKHTTQHSGFRDVPVLQITKASDSYASAVQAKFPWADPSLVQRLGEANWERHERLRNLEKTALDSAEQLLAQDLPPPKSQFQPVSLFRDSALGSSIAPRSQSAASAASHSSFASSKDGAERGRLRVPNMPKGISFGKSFECPFCKKWLSSIRSRIDWKMHVFADLQSYICVHNDCPDILTTFPSRKAWFEHETTCHLSRHTICCPQCDASYEKENDFLDHCERQHNMILRNPQLRSSALANAIVSYPENPSSIQCALCSRRGFASLRDYSTHLGRELEEVSLYPLPDLDDSDDENEDDSENESSGREITPDIARTTPNTHSSSSFSKDNGKKNAGGQDYPLGLNLQLEEDYTIKCICGFTSDDGNTVYCEECDTWQHIQCYYLSERVPKVHYCSDCVPNNKVDAKKAHERQLRLREAPDAQDMGPAPPRAAPKESSRGTTTSYWSTLEQQHFPALVGYYGRDFSAIATHLETKTMTMVKNQYFREIGNGKMYIEKLAEAAERRRDAGEPLGRPPDPLPPRRRSTAALEPVLETLSHIQARFQQEDLKLPIDAAKRKGKKAESTTSR